MRVRVLSYNIHKCIGGLDRQYKPDRVGDTIAHYQPDVVMLQEVDAGCKRSERHRQVDVLSEMLGLPHQTWHPNVAVRGGGQYGNATLSRFPLLNNENIDLSVPLKKKRSVLHAHLLIDRDRSLHVFNLHLGLFGPERRIQLQKLLASQVLRGLPSTAPVVVAGDFNDVWETLGQSILTPAGFKTIASPLKTFPAYAPMRALDGMYVRGRARLVNLRRSQLDVARRASDHLPLIADIELA